MRIIHTSDWHLGKNLEGVSRLEEQEKFCKDFIELSREKEVDMVLIAGDVYDTYNPPAAAESLFYQTIQELSEFSMVYIIAGNHDNPDRLEAIRPLVEKRGISILGYPLSQAKVGEYRGFEILETKEGFTKARIGEEVINIIGLAYPSEKRLNEVMENFEDETKLQETYSQKVGSIFRELEKEFREDEINIATSHIFVMGSSKSDSERRIELGGSLLVEKDDLPEKSQYTALGHIHKPQRISKKYRAYYSGSPIQYSKSERSTAKSVYLVDIHAGEEAEVEQIYLNNYKQIILFKCESIEEALEVCEENKGKDIFSYFEIKTEESIDPAHIREMKKLMKNILEIKPIITDEDYQAENEAVEINQGNIEGYFVDFYKKERDGESPSEDVVKLFRELMEG